MASSALLKFLLIAEDRTGKGFGSAAKGMTGMQKAAVAAGVAVAATGAFLLSAAKNAAEDEKGQRRLAIALKNTAGASDSTVAAVESWISQIGVATGVSDDQLRPALQRLVQATGDVGRAQDLMRVAMDVSAGSGKSLEVVTAALAKAQNGNMGALSKLGVKIKDADGKTMSFKDTVAQMSQTFKGQMAASAESVEGKLGRLGLVVDETKEGIGSALLPVASALGTVMLTKVVPAVQKASSWFDGLSDGTKTAAVSALLAVGGLLAVSVAATKVAAGVRATAEVMRGLHTAWQVGVAIARVYSMSALATARALAAQGVAAASTAVGWVRNTAAMIANRAVTIAVAGAAKAMAAAQWLVNVAMTANPIGLVVAALVALGAGLVIAWKKSETFRNIVKGAFSALGRGVLTLASLWLGGMKTMTGIFLGFVSTVISGAAKAFGWIPGVGGKLKSAAANFEAFRGTVSTQFDRAIGKVNQWKSKLDSVDKKKVTATVDVDESGAVRGSKNAQKAINSVHGKTVDIRLNWTSNYSGWAAYARAHGIPTHAFGGMVRGAGTGLSDSVMIAASPGEWVSRAATVNRLGPDFFRALDAGMTPVVPVASRGSGGGVVVNIYGGMSTSGEIARAVTRAILDEERASGRQLLPR